MINRPGGENAVAAVFKHLKIRQQYQHVFGVDLLVRYIPVPVKGNILLIVPEICQFSAGKLCEFLFDATDRLLDFLLTEGGRSACCNRSAVRNALGFAGGQSKTDCEAKKQTPELFHHPCSPLFFFVRFIPFVSRRHAGALILRIAQIPAFYKDDIGARALQKNTCRPHCKGCKCFCLLFLAGA